MKIDDVKEWLEIADKDFDSAILLHEAVRKHHEIICYLCAQAAEKYLKGFLVYNNIIPQKSHDLRFLHNCCFDIDNTFNEIITECAFLNKFANDVRYPHKYEVTEAESNYSIRAVEKIRNCKPLHTVRSLIAH